MKNNFIGEIVLSILLIWLLICFIKPIEPLIPAILHPMMVPLLGILFIVFSGFLWKEKPGDEREQLHKFIASRFAYFAVITTLIIGVIVQYFTDKIDPWLIVAVCIALLAKIFGLIYGHIKH